VIGGEGVLFESTGTSVDVSRVVVRDVRGGGAIRGLVVTVIVV